MVRPWEPGLEFAPVDPLNCNRDSEWSPVNVYEKQKAGLDKSNLGSETRRIHPRTMGKFGYQGTRKVWSPGVVFRRPGNRKISGTSVQWSKIDHYQKLMSFVPLHQWWVVSHSTDLEWVHGTERWRTGVYRWLVLCQLAPRPQSR